MEALVNTAHECCVGYWTYHRDQIYHLKQLQEWTIYLGSLYENN